MECFISLFTRLMILLGGLGAMGKDKKALLPAFDVIEFVQKLNVPVDELLI